MSTYLICCVAKQVILHILQVILHRGQESFITQLFSLSQKRMGFIWGSGSYQSFSLMSSLSLLLQLNMACSLEIYMQVSVKHFCLLFSKHVLRCKLEVSVGCVYHKVRFSHGQLLVYLSWSQLDIIIQSV